MSEMVQVQERVFGDSQPTRSHAGPRRLLARAAKAYDLLRFLAVQRLGGFAVPDEPLLDEEGGLEFRRLLNQCSLYAEFGCGGSTVLAAKLGLPVISVDSDRYYAKAVAKKLPPGHAVYLRSANIGLTKAWGYPLRNRDDGRWRAYLDAMTWALQDEARFPDLVMIDGRFRVACALSMARQAAEKRASTILFFDDYAEREHYHVLEKILGAPTLFGRAARFVLDKPVRDVTLAMVDAALRDPR